MSTININEAAEIVMNAEVKALEAMKTALDALDSELETILATLPEKLSIDARRIANELRNALSYQRATMIPIVLNKYSPQPEAPTYTAPTQA